MFFRPRITHSMSGGPGDIQAGNIGASGFDWPEDTIGGSESLGNASTHPKTGSLLEEKARECLFGVAVLGDSTLARRVDRR